MPLNHLTAYRCRRTGVFEQGQRTHQKVSSAPKTRRCMAECGLMTTTGLVGLLLYISTASATAFCTPCAGRSMKHDLVVLKHRRGPYVPDCDTRTVLGWIPNGAGRMLQRFCTRMSPLHRPLEGMPRNVRVSPAGQEMGLQDRPASLAGGSRVSERAYSIGMDNAPGADLASSSPSPARATHPWPA